MYVCVRLSCVEGKAGHCFFVCHAYGYRFGPGSVWISGSGSALIMGLGLPHRSQPHRVNRP